MSTLTRACSRLALLLSLLLCTPACDDLLIGNAYLEAGNDAALAVLDAGLDASALIDASSAAPDVVTFDAAVDSETQALLAASHALGGAQRWLSPGGSSLTTVSNLQLAFQPSLTSAEGTFLGYCPTGCPFLELFRDGGTPGRSSNTTSKTPETFSGRYVLYRLAPPADTVFGLLYTEDGLITIDIQIDWGMHVIGTPLEQVFVVFPPFGRFTFSPLRN